MNAIDGYKSYIGAGLGALIALLLGFGVIDGTQATWAAGIAASIFGAGVAGKLEKAKKATQDLIDIVTENAAPALLVAGLAALTLGSASPAMAADCNFANGVDAKLVRFAWPPAVGVNGLGFLDFEAGLPTFTTGCGNASADLVGGVCLIPKVNTLLPGFLCGASAPPVEE